MVRLNVNLEVILQSIRMEKRHGSLRIVIILMFRRFAWFRFDQKLKIVSHFLLVRNGHTKQSSARITFMSDIGI